MNGQWSDGERNVTEASNSKSDVNDGTVIGESERATGRVEDDATRAGTSLSFFSDFSPSRIDEEIERLFDDDHELDLSPPRLEVFSAQNDPNHKNALTSQTLQPTEVSAICPATTVLALPNVSSTLPQTTITNTNTGVTSFQPVSDGLINTCSTGQPVQSAFREFFYNHIFFKYAFLFSKRFVFNFSSNVVKDRLESI